MSKSSVVYVGDEVRDVEAAKKVGIPVFAVTWGFNKKSILQSAKPDALISSPEELIYSINLLLKYL